MLSINQLSKIVNKIYKQLELITNGNQTIISTNNMDNYDIDEELHVNE